MVSTWPGSRTSGSSPMTSRFVACQRGHHREISACVAPGPRCAAAIPHRVSPRWTTTVPAGPARQAGPTTRWDASGWGRTSGAAATHAPCGAEAGRGWAPMSDEGLRRADSTREGDPIDAADPMGGAGSAGEPDPTGEPAADAAERCVAVVMGVAREVAGRATVLAPMPRTAATRRRARCGATAAAAERAHLPSQPGNKARRSRSTPTVSQAPTPRARPATATRITSAGRAGLSPDRSRRPGATSRCHHCTSPAVAAVHPISRTAPRKVSKGKEGRLMSFDVVCT